MTVSIDPRAHFRALATDRLKALLPSLALAIRSSAVLPVPGAGQAGAPAQPSILVYCDRIRSSDTSNGVGPPAFRSIVTLAVVVRSERRTVPEIEAQLDVLAHAARNGLLTDMAFLVDVDVVERVDADRETRAEGERTVGQDTITFDLRCTEQFAPVIPDLLASVTMVLDAIDPADPLGAYPGLAGFPAPAAPPRAQGPDGRAEAETRIVYPQS